METIPYLAIGGAAVAHFIIGFLWYSPFLFGKIWMKEMGYTEKDCNTDGMAGKMITSLISSVVMAYVLMNLLMLLSIDTMRDGFELVLWIWIGFIATVQVGKILWEKGTITLYALNIAYWLVGLLAMMAILVQWG